MQRSWPSTETRAVSRERKAPRGVFGFRASVTAMDMGFLNDSSLRGSRPESSVSQRGGVKRKIGEGANLGAAEGFIVPHEL